MKEINIEIITPSKVVYKGIASSITVPGSLGSFQVLFNHAPIISSFEIGKVKIVENGGSELEFATAGGTVEVLDNKVLLLAESIERKDSIDISRAEKALHRAKDRLAKKSNEENIDLARAEASLKRAMNRLKIAGRN